MLYWPKRQGLGRCLLVDETLDTAACVSGDSRRPRLCHQHPRCSPRWQQGTPTCLADGSPLRLPIPHYSGSRTESCARLIAFASRKEYGHAKCATSDPVPICGENRTFFVRCRNVAGYATWRRWVSLIVAKTWDAGETPLHCSVGRGEKRRSTAFLIRRTAKLVRTGAQNPND